MKTSRERHRHAVARVAIISSIQKERNSARFYLQTSNRILLQRFVGSMPHGSNAQTDTKEQCGRMCLCTDMTTQSTRQSRRLQRAVLLGINTSKMYSFSITTKQKHSIT